jgi:hypothetical protein
MKKFTTIHGSNSEIGATKIRKELMKSFLQSVTKNVTLDLDESITRSRVVVFINCDANVDIDECMRNTFPNSKEVLDVKKPSTFSAKVITLNNQEDVFKYLLGITTDAEIFINVPNKLDSDMVFRLSIFASSTDNFSITCSKLENNKETGVIDDFLAIAEETGCLEEYLERIKESNEDF